MAKFMVTGLVTISVSTIVDDVENEDSLAFEEVEED